LFTATGAFSGAFSCFQVLHSLFLDALIWPLVRQFWLACCLGVRLFGAFLPFFPDGHSGAALPVRFCSGHSQSEGEVLCGDLPLGDVVQIRLQGQCPLSVFFIPTTF